MQPVAVGEGLLVHWVQVRCVRWQGMSVFGVGLHRVSGIITQSIHSYSTAAKRSKNFGVHNLNNRILPPAKPHNTLTKSVRRHCLLGMKT